MRKALQAEQGKADMERKVCQRVLVLHNFLTLQCSLKLESKCSSQFLVAREIYKCHFENTTIFSNYLLANVHVNLMLLLFYFHKWRMQVPISRNTLKYLNLDKLNHYITCKSYTKVLTFWIKIQKSGLHEALTKRQYLRILWYFFKWPITFNEPLNKQITK